MPLSSSPAPAAAPPPPLLSFRGLCQAEAHPLWNCLCLPLVLLYNSLVLILLPTLLAYARRAWAALVWLLYRVLGGCLGPYQYTDAAWSGARALGDCAGYKGAQLAKELEWVRAAELAGAPAAAGAKPRPMVLFEGRIEPSDLLQGGVGDCWLVAALAVMAENPAAIRACILESELSPRGMYHVRLFDGRAQQWEEVCVDDLIPVRKGSRRCMFMSPHGPELWAILLEKAFAKFCGSYGALEGGMALWAYQALTGDRVFKLWKDGAGDHWERNNLHFTPGGKRRDCGLVGTGEKLSTWSDLHGVLLAYKARKCVMGASIIPSTKQREHQRADGLVEGHAYSILDVRAAGGGALAALQKMGVHVGENKVHNLVRLRNPWGSHGWKGNWGRGDGMWRAFPDVAQELHYKEGGEE
jgi:hypothetical protein